MGVWLVGVDTGGTFTDLVAFEQATGELRPPRCLRAGDPSAAVIDALDKLFADGVTRAISALSFTGRRSQPMRCSKARASGRPADHARLPCRVRGARLVAAARRPICSTPSSEAAVAGAAVADRGGSPSASTIRVSVSTPLDEAAVRASARTAQGKGVRRSRSASCSRSSIPTHERRAAEIVAEEAPECRISLSSNVLPVIREYPRLSTTVIDAYVGPDHRTTT